MEDYPRDLTEFEARFANEAACRDYLFRLRWPDGFRCPRCGGSGAWPLRSVLLECAACRYQTSVTAGTIFQDTRKPLTLWFRAMWWVTSQKNGASALGMQRVLGLGSYKTAWTWLHKLRRAMVRPGRDRLSGTIEVNNAPDAEVLELAANFRSTPRIIAVANHWAKTIGAVRPMSSPDMSHGNKKRIDFDKSHVAALEFGDSSGEAAWIARTIKELIKAKGQRTGAAHDRKDGQRGIAYADIAILLRSSTDA